MKGIDKILLLKALNAAAVANEAITTLNESVTTITEVMEDQEPVVVTTPGSKDLTSKQKNVKADATSGDITVNLPTTGISEFDTVAITKTDASANTITISGLIGDDKVLYYQYQSAIAMYDGSDWNIIDQVLQPSDTKAEIHKDTSPPTDLTQLWYDMN